MSATRIQLVSKGRRTQFFSSPGFMSADHPWAGYSFEEADGPAEPLPAHSWSKTTLLLVTSGCTSVNWKHRGIWRRDSMPCGTVSILRRDVEIQSAVPSAPVPTMVLQLDNAKLRHIAEDHVLTIDKALDPVQVTGDVRLAALLYAMREEVREGCESGRLFAESISLALLAYLAGKYATPAPAGHEAASLSPAQKRSIVEYIHENLADNISVTELAQQLQMSASHFARVFKSSFGTTPYRFVMQERIEGAKRMLAITDMSASQVAMAFGFSSQSHFVRVFRQFAGVTPKQFKLG